MTCAWVRFDWKRLYGSKRKNVVERREREGERKEYARTIKKENEKEI